MWLLRNVLYAHMDIVDIPYAHNVNNERALGLTQVQTSEKHFGMQSAQVYTPDDERLI